jgi:hypothetical protein
MNTLKKLEGVSSLGSDFGEIARGSESTLMSLKTEIENLRALHKTDFERFKSNARQDEKLIAAIQTKTSEKILFDIERFERLKGECEFERSF